MVWPPLAKYRSVLGWTRLSWTCWTERTTRPYCKIPLFFSFHWDIYCETSPVSSITSSLDSPSHFPSTSPAGTSWFAWSAWRPWCQGREGTPRSYRSHWTPRRAGREGRQRSAWASGIPWIKRRDCECDFLNIRSSVTPLTLSNAWCYIQIPLNIFMFSDSL